MDRGDGSAEAWIASFTKQLRSQLPKGQFILSHARELFLGCDRVIRLRLTRADVTAVAPWYVNRFICR